MKMRKSKFIAAILMAVCITLAWIPAALGEQPSKQETKVEPRFIAYYFYTSRRCGPCTTIERYAREAVTQGFKEQLESGRLQWQALNVEKPENKHFIDDFKLYTKSVIIAEYKDGKPVRWENLENVWRLYRDKQKYIDYVVGKTKAFMEKS